MKTGTKFTTVDSYIAAQPEALHPKLQAIRKTIRNAAPDAEESIAYGMPAYKLNGKPLVYFGTGKNHIGFYATPAGHEAFAEDLSKYKQGKGSVQFPLDEALPVTLIRRMIQFRVKENSAHKKIIK